MVRPDLLSVLPIDAAAGSGRSAPLVCVWHRRGTYQCHAPKTETARRLTPPGSLLNLWPHLSPSIVAARAKRGCRLCGTPSSQGSGSAAVAEGRGDRAGGGTLLDVLHPLVVTNVSLRRPG